MPPLLPYVALEQQLDLYRAKCAEHGTEPDIVWIHACHLDEDRETALREARDWMIGFIQGNCSPLTEYDEAAGRGSRSRPATASTRPGSWSSSPSSPYEQLIEDDYVWVGTPADVIERIEATLRGLRRASTEIAITVNAGGAPHWMAIKNQELFAAAGDAALRGAAATRVGGPAA